MMSRRKHATAATLLIVLMKSVSGHKLPCDEEEEYQIRQECCLRCPPGNRVKRDCIKFQSTSCLPCTEGTYIKQPTERTRCYTCTSCDAGSGLKIKRTCTTTSDTVCEPLEGFYCTESAEESCRAAKKHTNCSSGQYINQTGTSSRDTECSDCSDGTYSDGTFTSCQTHTQCESLNLQLIKAGNVSTDAECGEQSSDWTGVVIGIVVVFVLFLCIIAAVYMWKKKCSPKGRNRNVDDPEQNRQSGEETSGMMKKQQQELGGSIHQESQRDGTPPPRVSTLPGSILSSSHQPTPPNPSIHPSIQLKPPLKSCYLSIKH